MLRGWGWPSWDELCFAPCNKICPSVPSFSPNINVDSCCGVITMLHGIDFFLGAYVKTDSPGGNTNVAANTIVLRYEGRHRLSYLRARQSTTEAVLTVCSCEWLISVQLSVGDGRLTSIELQWLDRVNSDDRLATKLTVITHTDVDGRRIELLQWQQLYSTCTQQIFFVHTYQLINLLKFKTIKNKIGNDGINV